MRALASLKLTVGLLIVIAIVLSWATIVESLRGTEAGQAIYNSIWFYGLQGVFSLNIVAALWERIDAAEGAMPPCRDADSLRAFLVKLASRLVPESLSQEGGRPGVRAVAGASRSIRGVPVSSR